MALLPRWLRNKGGTEHRNSFLTFAKSDASQPLVEVDQVDGDPEESSGDIVLETIPYLRHHLAQYCAALRVCVIANRDVTDLSAFAECPKLVKLDAHHNQVKFLPSPAMWSRLTSLQVLYIHDNVIESLETVMHLTAARCLKTMTMFGNPLCEGGHYRSIVVNRVTSLQALDDCVITDDEIIGGLNASVVARFAAESDFVRVNLYVPPKDTIEEEMMSIAELQRLVSGKIAHHSLIILMQRYIRGWLVRNKLKNSKEKLRKSAERDALAHSILTVPAIQHPNKRSPLELFFPPLAANSTITAGNGIDAKWLQKKHILAANSLPRHKSQQEDATTKEEKQTGHRSNWKMRKLMMHRTATGPADQRTHLHQQRSLSEVKSLPNLKSCEERLHQVKDWSSCQAEDMQGQYFMSSGSRSKPRLNEEEETRNKPAAQQLRIHKEAHDMRDTLELLKEQKTNEHLDALESARDAIRFARETRVRDDDMRYHKICAASHLGKLRRYTVLTNSKLGKQQRPSRTLRAQPGDGHHRAIAMQTQAQLQQEDRRLRRWKREHGELVRSAQDSKTQDQIGKLQRLAATQSNTSCAAVVRKVRECFEDDFSCQMTSVIRTLQNNTRRKRQEERLAHRSNEAKCQHALEAHSIRKINIFKQSRALQTAIGHADERRALESTMSEMNASESKQAQEHVSKLRQEAKRRADALSDTLLRSQVRKGQCAPVGQFSIEATENVDDKTSQALRRFPARDVRIGHPGQLPPATKYCACPAEERHITHL